MSRSQIDPPAGVPVLARGKHKNPRKGACFMELASYLAGERWSDNPRCTHPLLASLARLVNDGTTDAGRSRLAEHIPAVIGMTSDDPRVDVRIALLSAHKALPVASAEPSRPELPRRRRHRRRKRRSLSRPRLLGRPRLLSSHLRRRLPGGRRARHRPFERPPSAGVRLSTGIIAA